MNWLLDPSSHFEKILRLSSTLRSLFLCIPSVFRGFSLHFQPQKDAMNGAVVQPAQTLNRDADSFLRRTVQDLFSLKGRTIVITGGARGIGLSFGFAVAEAGGNVALLDLLTEPHPHYYKLEKDYGVKVKIYKSDVTKHQVLGETFEEIVKDFGRIDGLVTAAGVCPDEPFVERKPESVARCMNINVLGTYFAAQFAAAQMMRQEPLSDQQCRGSIVMVASIAAYVASKGQCTSDYCASKGAVVSLARALGVELAMKGIRVNSISPGYMMTDMTLDIADKNPHLASIMTTEPPMRRMGDRTDLKGLLVYLLSDASAYQTSEDILVTGGIHAGRLLFSTSRVKKRRSLLFVSLVTATASVFSYFIGFITEYSELLVFWAFLILQDRRNLRAVKWMIIVDAGVLHTSTTMSRYEKSYGSHPKQFLHAFFYIEKLQMTSQPASDSVYKEFIISGLYLWETTALLKVAEKKGARPAMVELSATNVVIVMADIALVALEYSGETLMERTWKGLICSVKLKLEFTILSKLANIVRAPRTSLANALAEFDTFHDATRTNTASMSLPTNATIRRKCPYEIPDWLLALEGRAVHLKDMSKGSLRHETKLQCVADRSCSTTRKNAQVASYAKLYPVWGP
ncbi:hypothetical protein CLAIMM_12405 [Cladophialophora immunda]|nr:hypothetical protein CLAIMM_12405 [Cladophialophora immunda]